MQNEPNLKNTKTNVTLFTAVNYGNFHSLEHRKNEPKTNPIQTNRLLSWPAVRFLSTYSGKALRKKCCASSRLPAKTAYLFRAPNDNQFEQNMQNEPNLQNAQINVNSVKTRYYADFHPIALRKNEPNTNPTWCGAKLPILTKEEVNQKMQKMQKEPNSNPIISIPVS